MRFLFLLCAFVALLNLIPSNSLAVNEDAVAESGEPICIRFPKFSPAAPEGLKGRKLFKFEKIGKDHRALLYSGPESVLFRTCLARDSHEIIYWLQGDQVHVSKRSCADLEGSKIEALYRCQLGKPRCAQRGKIPSFIRTCASDPTDISRHWARGWIASHHELRKLDNLSKEHSEWQLIFKRDDVVETDPIRTTIALLKKSRLYQICTDGNVKVIVDGKNFELLKGECGFFRGMNIGIELVDSNRANRASGTFELVSEGVALPVE